VRIATDASGLVRPGCAFALALSGAWSASKWAVGRPSRQRRRRRPVSSRPPARRHTRPAGPFLTCRRPAEGGAQRCARPPIVFRCLSVAAIKPDARQESGADERRRLARQLALDSFACFRPKIMTSNKFTLIDAGRARGRHSISRVVPFLFARAVDAIRPRAGSGRPLAGSRLNFEPARGSGVWPPPVGRPTCVVVTLDCTRRPPSGARSLDAAVRRAPFWFH
jgi:hypothetical protein